MSRVRGQPRSATLVAIVALGLLAACGGSSAEVVPAVSPTAAPSATATPEATSTVTPTATASPEPTPEATAEPTPEPRFDDLVASTTFIPVEELPRVEFTSLDATATLAIEVPPRNEYGIGLSGRYQLADRGMLFYYVEGNRGGFWMRNTHIDLDIAFVDFNLRIIDILQMEADTDTIHSPDALYLAAIEAPLGWYEAASIEPGDGVGFLFDVDAAVAAAESAE